MSERQESPPGYEIVSRLGAGSFGTVYRAHQVSTGQDVAIKVLRPPPIEDGGSEAANRTSRFRREMRLCAELWHPHIVRLLDSGVLDDGRPFAVFEYVPGQTLRQVLDREGKLPLGDALRLMGDVLDALSCAHARGVVHRDLKPENIMITQTGTRRHALVLDFGLGGFVAESERAALERLTAPFELLGTPCYAAPEQLRGGEVSSLSDLYSWGLILLECLTGEMIMQGASGYDVVSRQLSAESVPIPAWLRGHPIGRTLELVTAKQPSRRSPTTAAILATLECLAANTARIDAVPGAPSECRQVTVLSCAIRIAAPDGRPLDVEQVDERLRAVHATISDCAAAAGASVVELFGTRAVVLFGMPTAREEDARRAVALAAELVTATSQRVDPHVGHKVELAIGIHSGLVVVRERDTLAATPTLLGLVPEVAMRLAERAAPGEVLLTADTFRLLRGGAQAVQVEALPVPEEHRAIAALRLQRGSDGLRSDDHGEPVVPETPLVGRGALLAQLRTAWDEARNGRASAVLLTGEPGIGKSRLIRELRQIAGDSTWLEARCLAERADMPLEPIAGLLRGLPGTLASRCARHGLDRDGTLPLLEALAAPGATPLAQPDASPERRRELTMRAITTLVLRMAEDAPAVLAVEDLHWADPSTVEVLTQLVEAARQGGRLLLAFTARPDFAPPWRIDEVTTVPVPGLDRSQAMQLATAVLGGRALPSEVLQDIAARCDGIPLFVEELVHALVEQGPAVDDSGGSVASGMPSRIPVSLRDLLRARIDGLSELARHVIQLAAVLGRDFPFELLHAASGVEEAALRGALREITGAGMLRQRREAPGETIMFKHALVRDAAYEVMTRSVRARLHRIALEVLRAQRPDLDETQPELVALHLEGGGESLEAAVKWQRAAHHALGRGAYVEADRLLRRALALVRDLPESADRLRVESDLLISLGTALFSTRGYGAPEVELVFKQAREVIGRLGDESSVGVVAGLASVHFTRSDRAESTELLPHLKRLAASSDDLVSRITGSAQLGVHAFWVGRLAAAQEYLGQAIALHDTPEFLAFARGYGYDGGLFCHAYHMLASWLLGLPEQALAMDRVIVEIATRTGNPYSRALSLGFGACLAYDLGDADGVARRADELADLSAREHLHLWLVIAACARGWALHLRGDPASAAGEMQAALAMLDGMGVRSSHAYFTPPLGVALGEAGEVRQALRVIDAELERADVLLAQVHVPELHRVRGELLSRSGDLSDAERALRTALGLAHASGALAYELRAATSLAAVLRDSQRAAEGRVLLGGVQARFADGGDTRDLRRATTVLRDLG